MMKSIKGVGDDGRNKDLLVSTIKITFDAMDIPGYKIPAGLLDKLQRLQKSSIANPLETIPNLLELIKTYPKVPCLYNYLSIAYKASEQRGKMREVDLKCYELFPDYIFGVSQYAMSCIEDKKFDMVPKIYRGQFEIQTFAKRDFFHFSEVLSFYGTLGFYHNAINDWKQAMVFLELMRKVDANHQLTKRLEQELQPSGMKLIENFLLEKIKGATKKRNRKPK